MNELADSTISKAIWDGLLARDAAALRAAPLYGKLLTPPGSADGAFVIGRIAQTLDGRIATRNGRSFWISGEADILHTHRLRALFDAIVVGASTVRADDPQLTTRACPGPSPVRVILDTDRRLGPNHRVFQGGPRTLLLCAEDTDGDAPGAAELLRLPRATPSHATPSHAGPGESSTGLDAAAIVAALARRGLRRIFIEGGGITVSRFLAAACLDRLHVTIAPLLLGSGIPAFTLPEIAHPQDGLRLAWSVHRLGDDLLLDIPLERRPASRP
jgi:riboflavin-specific deaminase-like protein